MHALTRDLNLCIQLINLLKREALRLIDHEIHKSDAQKAAGEPDEEDLRLEICVPWTPVHEVRGRVGNRPVEQPVCRGRHGERFRPDFEREDLPRHHPGDGAPGRGEEEDVDADEGDGGLLRAEVLGEDVSVGRLAGGGRAEDRDQELGDGHADCWGERR